MPRTLRENLRFRKKILEAAAGDRDVQARLKAMCKDDCLFYVNTFVWQFNPTEAKNGLKAVEPFITFPIQERVLTARPETHAEFRPYDRGLFWCIEHDKTMALEKSRFQGASWLCLIAEDWHCGFHEFVKLLNISRNEDAVDDGTKDSLFWKLRYMHERLPEWLLGPIDDAKLYFHFHDSDSEITGTASTSKAGVGGRASWIFVDEFPEITAATEVRQKTALTADARVFVGTHLGAGTEFEAMCDPRKSPEIVRQRMHWTDNPQQNAGLYQYDPLNPGKPRILDTTYAFPKGYKFVLDGSPAGGHAPGVRSPWYDRKCVEIGDARAVASHLDIDVQGAAKQFFDPIKVRNLIERATPPLWVGHVDVDPAGRFRRLDEDRDNGKFRLWVVPVDDGQRLVRSKYFVGGDVAAGTGATPSCLAIVDAKIGRKIGEYVDPFIEERPFAQLAVGVCGWLVDADGSTAKFAWDMGGQQGVKFEKEVLALGYRNIFYNEDDIQHLVRPGRASKRPGFYGRGGPFYRVIKDYRDAIYSGTLTDPSADCLAETLLFEWDEQTREVAHSGAKRSTDPSGARENHGDRVTATMLAWMMAKDHAAGGRLDPAPAQGPDPYSLEWLLALQPRDEDVLLPYD